MAPRAVRRGAGSRALADDATQPGHLLPISPGHAARLGPVVWGEGRGRRTFGAVRAVAGLSTAPSGVQGRVRPWLRWTGAWHALTGPPHGPSPGSSQGRGGARCGPLPVRLGPDHCTGPHAPLRPNPLHLPGGRAPNPPSGRVQSLPAAGACPGPPGRGPSRSHGVCQRGTPQTSLTPRCLWGTSPCPMPDRPGCAPG